MADLDQTNQDFNKEQQYSARSSSYQSQFERDMDELKGQRDALEESNRAMMRELDQAKEFLQQERERVAELERTRRLQHDSGSI
eukprot:3854887-Amphidinium_carterae.1